MDPEDLREVISAYQKCVAETVQRFGGFVAKYMGDGVLIYFGYPQAHEDDAERAVRAGLELIQAVGGLKSSTSLQTRVGIATGLVVVGDLIGAGESQERGIVGETPNLVARLQGIAEPNTVVIAESTRGLLGNLFDLKDLGTKDLKGVSEPVQTWAALRAKGTSLLHTGDIAGGRAHLERAIALYDPAVHRPLVPRFVHDIRVTALGFRSLALWLLGYPVASLADAAEALKEAREIGHAGSLMFALWMGFISVLCGDFLAAIAQADELLALAESKGTD
jgi:Adenylate and Guanylate cyclase catalytic domain